jgi:hypothetical protein
MTNLKKIATFKSLNRLTDRLRDDLANGGSDFLLLFAYNGTGKTRISMAFKDKGKRDKKNDTLYFNAFTEDLFSWDNDLSNDTARKLLLNKDSNFFAGFQQLALEEKIFAHLENYADFDFKINYENREVSFSRNEIFIQKSELKTRLVENIKISRGEENLFIWCTFLAICELAIDKEEGSAYDWVKYIYIDDPISSIDDNNVVALASDLGKLLRKAKNNVKVAISTHHGLFFNIMTNEIKKHAHKTYFLYRDKKTNFYQLQTTGDTPFFYHVAMLKELKDAAEADPPRVYTYHFNVLRSIMEKTASFFGAEDFSVCMADMADRDMFARAMNLLSHGQYSIYEPKKMLSDTQQLFLQILNAFLQKYPFQLPNLEPTLSAEGTSTNLPAEAP